MTTFRSFSTVWCSNKNVLSISAIFSSPNTIAEQLGVAMLPCWTCTNISREPSRTCVRSTTLSRCQLRQHNNAVCIDDVTDRHRRARIRWAKPYTNNIPIPTICDPNKVVCHFVCISHVMFVCAFANDYAHSHCGAAAGLLICRMANRNVRTWWFITLYVICYAPRGARVLHSSPFSRCWPCSTIMPFKRIREALAALPVGQFRRCCENTVG